MEKKLKEEVRENMKKVAEESHENNGQQNVGYETYEIPVAVANEIESLKAEVVIYSYSTMMAVDFMTELVDIMEKRFNLTPGTLEEYRISVDWLIEQAIKELDELDQEYADEESESGNDISDDSPEASKEE